MTYITIDDKNRLDALRRKAARRGLRLTTTTRWRYHTIDNYGGAMLIDSYSNIVVYGDRYSLDLNDIEDVLKNYDLVSES
jgi:hypothetical protein